MKRAQLPLVLLTVVAAVLAATPRPASAELPTLIPREVLLGNPEKSVAQISPDGKHISWVAPDKNNVQQVWVKDLADTGEGKMVTADKKRGIRMYFWTEDSSRVIYLQDSDGDENFHMYGVELATGNVRDYTPFQGVRGNLVAISTKVKDKILVGMNLRKRDVFDVYSVDLTTGAIVSVAENPGDVIDWVADDDLNIRVATANLEDGSTEIRVRDKGKGAKWRTLLTAGPEETVTVYDVSADGKQVLLVSSLGSDTSRVIWRDLKGTKEKEVAKSDAVDAGAIALHPTKHTVQAVNFPVGRNDWKVIDPSVKQDFEAIAKLADDDFSIVSRDDADQKWILGFSGRPAFWLWDRKEQKGTLLFYARPLLDKYTLAETKPIDIKSRDGLVLHSYLTLPAGVPGKNLPLVLSVHGGPWGRDTWGFNGNTQLLANRGYAVLQVNFRASTGFGKKFLHAGDKQWGLTMQDDLTDGVRWAIEQGIADPKKVCIMGGSYGGYATLAGAAFTPDLYRCGVDIVGPSNLFTLLASIPPYWKPLLATFYNRMGHPEKDKEVLTKASPLFSAAKIKIPMLIGQGANDPRVKQAESDQIVAAIEKNKGRATYVIYTDEGHGFQRPENRLDFAARTEAFLGENLGGRVEPLKGDKVPGSTAVVKVIGKR
jgi:dipeptidyl aminopeptidase/acylaminoacyl peptidase